MSRNVLYLPVAVLVTPGTSGAAPEVTAVPLPDGLLRAVTVRIPPGPKGAVGFYIAQAGTPIVPWGMPPNFLVGNDETLPFDIDSDTSQSISVAAYNTGAYYHSLYFRFEVTPASLITPAIPFVTVRPIQ